jgi:hypothetical protein
MPSEAILEGADKTQKIVDSLGQEVVRISKLLENPTLNESDRSRLQGQLNGAISGIQHCARFSERASEQIKNIREQSGKGCRCWMALITPVLAVPKAR